MKAVKDEERSRVRERRWSVVSASMVNTTWPPSEDLRSYARGGEMQHLRSLMNSDGGGSVPGAVRSRDSGEAGVLFNWEKVGALPGHGLVDWRQGAASAAMSKGTRRGDGAAPEGL
jgi:hypothetical protein